MLYTAFIQYYSTRDFKSQIEKLKKEREKEVLPITRDYAATFNSVFKLLHHKNKAVYTCMWASIEIAFKHGLPSRAYPEAILKVQ